MPWKRHTFFPLLLFVAGSFSLGETAPASVGVDSHPLGQTTKTELAQWTVERSPEFDRGSNIDFSSLTSRQITNLGTLCRVWGYLKYYHPKVTRGDLQWDDELFRILPEVLAASDPPSANAVLAAWIDRLGPFETGERPHTPADRVALRPDLGWIQDAATLGEPLCTRLRAVGQARISGQFYVSMLRAGNPSFDREPDYREIKFPDRGYQLLSLFRFWNIIRYWFPYRDLVDGDWDAVLKEFIPRIALAKDVTAYQLEMMALIAKVGDTHANLWSSLQVRPPVGDCQLPFKLRFVEGEALVTEVFSSSENETSTLERGDIIETIDGEPVAELVRKWAPYYAASNEPTRLRDIARFMGQGPAGPAKLRIRRAERITEIEIARLKMPSPPKESRYHDLPGPTFRLLSPRVAYLKLSSARIAEIPVYVREASGTTGWIIDARGYPEEPVISALCSQFVDHPKNYALRTRGSLEEPGAFLFTDPVALKAASPFAAPTPAAGISGNLDAILKSTYPGKVVVLVDETTQSQAEFSVMALRAAGAIVIGSTTAGADGDVSAIPLPGGFQARMSGVGVYYPDKRPTQRIGIVPDIVVTPTRAGIIAGRDEVIEAAVRQITGA